MSLDSRLALEVERVCSERNHRLTHVDSPGELHARLAESTRAVVLFDVGDAFDHGLRVATAVRAAYPTVPLVLATEAPSARSIDGFRLVDRWRAGERLVDELELAHIGIPATIAEPIRRTR
jgi:DNA-binding response OmpR family regulator